MFISKVVPNNERLTDPGNTDYHHEVIWSFFPGHVRNDRPFVYRQSTSGYIVVSKQPPVVDSSFSFTTMPYSRKVRKGTKLIFRVFLNATIRKYPDKGPAKDHDAVTNYIMELKAKNKAISSWPSSSEIYSNVLGAWFKERSPLHGFSVSDFLVLGKTNLSSKNFHITCYSLEGNLVVDNPDLFSSTLYKGIGAKRDRGCGLLLVRN